MTNFYCKETRTVENPSLCSVLEINFWITFYRFGHSECFAIGAVDGVKGNHLFLVVLFGKINAESTYRKVASTNASRFVTRLVFKHT